MEAVRTAVEIVGAFIGRDGNGPAVQGEGSAADAVGIAAYHTAQKAGAVGVAGGIGEGLIIKKGEILRKVKEEDLLSGLKEELDKML